MNISDEQIHLAYHSGQQAFAPGRRTLSWPHVAQQAVGSNTFRAFYRLNKQGESPSETIRRFMQRNDYIAAGLAQVTTEVDLDNFEERLTQELISSLTNVKPDMLMSYNRVRKVVDLYVLHFVAATKELEAHRERLAPLLYLPLDSQTLEVVFGMSGSMGDIRSRNHYLELQQKAARKATDLSNEHRIEFHRIYFDQFFTMAGQKRYEAPWLNYFLARR